MALDLSWNNIKTLHEYSFLRYPQLTDLDLSYNNITNITTTAFYSIKRLQYLDLSGNYNLKNIHGIMFKRSRNLLHLRLQNCSILSLSNDPFRWLPRLQAFFLQDNPINSINISVCPKNEVEYANLVNTNFEKLTNDTFIFRCKCKKLRLYFLALQYVEPEVIASLHVKELYIGVHPVSSDKSFTVKLFTDLFKGIAKSAVEMVSINNFDIWAFSAIAALTNKQLTKLEFFHFERSYFLEYINSSLFQGLSRVHSLDIFDSHIKRCDDFFVGMDELVDLDLSYNNLLFFEGVSYPLNSLLSLNLSFNLLDGIYNGSLNGLDYLVSLDLSGNRMFYFISISHVNLQYVNVSHNEIMDGDTLNAPNLIFFSFSGNVADPFMTGRYFHGLKNFKHTQSLRIVDLSNARIVLGAIYDVIHKVSLFAGLKNLTEIDLHVSGLLMIEYAMFAQLYVLERVYLSQCYIQNIDANAFDDLHSLSTLDLGDNEIVRLPSTLFSNTAQLQNLFIQGNILSYLPENLFNSIRNLTQLRLNRNEFIRLNRSVFSPIMSSIRFINVSENPFECSCNFKWMVEWLKTSRDLVQLVEGMCSPASENKLRGELLTHIDPGAMCDSQIPVYMIIPFIACTLFIIVIITFHNRWLLRYKAFLLKLFILGYREIEDLRAHHRDFHFDVNIMFAAADEVWATQFLKRNLEGKLPQFHRVAFGDDDLPLNMYYLDAVLYLIEHSFKTILLFTRAAIQDNDFMVKLRVALNHVTNVNMQSTILVFLENIPDEEMPYLVKSYLGEQMFYIDWVEGPEGQKYFWKELIKRLKVNVRRTDVEPPE